MKLKQDQLSGLINYQQKEYPLKAMAIYDLKGQEVRLGLFHQDEVRELKNLVEEEKGRLRQWENQQKTNIYQKITNIAVKNTPDQVL